MRRSPSFRARLIVGAIVWIGLAVTVSGLVLAGLFREHVTAQFDAELHGHASELAALVTLDADGRPVLARRLSDPRFQPPGSGFYWQIDAPSGAVATSSSLGGERLDLSGVPARPGVEGHGFVEGPRGLVRLVSTAIRPSGSASLVQIGIGIEERQLDQVLAGFNRTLWLSLGVLACALAAAASLQIWFGLQPLSSVRRALAAVRTGAAHRLPTDAPSEVLPLVQDLNALLQANQEMLLRARTQAGNLAHGLKTPLAILADEGERLRARGEVEAAEAILSQCERMRRQIDYQIARARAAAVRSAPGAVTRVDSALEAIVSAMARLHHGRGVDFQLQIQPALTHPPGAMVAVEAEDFSEMAANLADNAGKWARSRVRITATAEGPDKILICVEDDGCGLPPEAMDLVFNLGERLDEQAPGSGLGLAIVRDLSGLYGGRAWLEQSALGGLSACLELPRALV